MIAALIPAIAGIVDKLIPDPQLAAEAKLKALELAQKGELAQLDADVRLALGQMEINKVEAATAGLYKGGWRPAVGWVCVAGLFYSFLLKPLLPWLAIVLGFDAPELPPIDTMELLALISGMLGFGAYRTFERVKGKA